MFKIGSYRGTYQGQASTPILQIRNDTVANPVVGNNHQDDDYELLSKAIGVYNQGTAGFTGGNGRSWINALVDRNTPSSDRKSVV